MHERVGWREWVELPDLGIDWVKAKVDTGARSSSIHAENIELDGDRATFTISPWQGSAVDSTRVEAALIDVRSVRSSSGQTEERPTVSTTVRIRDTVVPIELTLSQRDQMGFRMLLGREALRRRFLVDPGQSYVGPKPPREVRARNRSADDDEE